MVLFFFYVELYEFFVLGWPKSSFRVSHKMLWQNLNELLGQPSILCINPLSDISFVNITSRSVGFLSILLIISFAVQKLLFIYLFLAVLGLRCCARAFSSCIQRGLLFVEVRRLLTAVASFVEEHRL